MKVYVVLWEDRHTDPDIIVYANKEEAITYAQNNVKKAMDEGGYEVEEDGEYGDQELNDTMLQAGWVYYGRYSCEGDCISVLEREVLRGR